MTAKTGETIPSPFLHPSSRQREETIKKRDIPQHPIPAQEYPEKLNRSFAKPCHSLWTLRPHKNFDTRCLYKPDNAIGIDKTRQTALKTLKKLSSKNKKEMEAVL